MLVVFIVEGRFSMIIFWVTNISPFLIWCIWHKCTFKIRLYMVFNHKHLYLTFLIWRICGRKLTHMVIISDRHYHCVYIPIRVRVITYACICCRYWDIYANISFSCAHTQWTCFSSYLTWSWLWSLMCTGTCSGNIICTCTS